MLPVAAGANVKQEPLASVDKALSGGLCQTHRCRGVQGKQRAQSLEITSLGALPAGRLLLLGIGQKAQMSNADWRVFAAKSARAANGAKAKSLVLGLPDGIAPDKLRYVAEGLVLGAYRFAKYFTGDRRPKAEIATVTIALGARGAPAKAHQNAIDVGQGVASAVSVDSQSGQRAPQRAQPGASGERSTSAWPRKPASRARSSTLKEIQKRGMKLLQAVGQGSVHKPCLVHITLHAREPKKQLVFVGKGITFDSGGLSIKPAAGMGEMKHDMSGAANVVGLMAAVAAVKPDVEVHGILAAAENMPDGNAYRPGDVFGSLDGKTVEIINTDAEGRLVLADALAYARELEPDLIVDNATLTGACVVALGPTVLRLLREPRRLADAASRTPAKAPASRCGACRSSRTSRISLKSDCADLKHTGDRWGGSITAALFLREFVGDVADWVHVDIAGPAMASNALQRLPQGRHRPRRPHVPPLIEDAAGERSKSAAP